MYVYDFTVPTREQLRPSLKFTPPTKTEGKKAEGKPLWSISRELWPSMTVTWHQPRAADVTSKAGLLRTEQEALWVGRLLMPGPEKEAASPLQPLTPALSPEYRGEGEMLEKMPAPRDGEPAPYGPMPLTGFEASGRDYPIDPEFEAAELERCAEEIDAVVPKAQRNKQRQMVDDLVYLRGHAEKPRGVAPTQEERDGFWEKLLLQELPTPGERTRANSGTKKSTGRLPKFTEQARKFLLHALRLGASRQEIARRLEIHPSSITRLLQRDAELAKEAAAAKQEGEKFYAIYEKLFYAGMCVVEPEPVVSNLFFEREKECLIARGLPAEWVRRLRQRTGREVFGTLYEEQAAEKVQARVEKQLARMDHDDGKSQRGMKIVRRSFCNRSGQPVEEIRYVVENHRPGKCPSGEKGIWKDMQEMLEKLPEW